MEIAPRITPVQVGLYARISSDREGERLGVDRQLADCERLAERKGWLIAERFVDNDASAWSGRRRPEYERLLAALGAGTLDGLLVYNLDRLHRQPRELEAFIDLCQELRLTKVASVEGDIDLTTADGQFQARILGAVAKKESDDKSRRIRRKHEELALRGKVSGGGSRPYGYEPDRRTVRPSEAAIVRECAKRVLAGESLRSVAIDLNARGVAAAGGGTWSSQTLRRTLSLARLSGQREHNGEIVSVAEWPAIITPSETAQLRALFADPNRRTRTGPRRYLLHGLLACSHCGERLVARPRAGGERRYHCARGPGFSGCGKTTIKAEPVEAFVVDAVLHRIDSPQIAAAVEGRPREPDAQRWYDELQAAQAQLEKLATAYGQRQITIEQLVAGSAPIKQRMTATRKQLSRVTHASALDPFVGKGEELREQWGSLDLSQQHASVAAVLDHLVVGPARRGYNRFDESRLRPVWRP